MRHRLSIFVTALGPVVPLVVLLTTGLLVRDAQCFLDEPRSLAVESAALGTIRTVRVWTPGGYAQGMDHFTVVYCADHDVDSPKAAGIMAELSRSGELPGLILVGVPSDDGRRDFTPTSSDAYGPTSGGGGVWLDHVEHEVIPLIESTFRTDGRRIWWGHSIVGALGVHAALDRPALFDGFVISSPWLIYDAPGRFLIESAERAIAEHADEVVPMYVGVGDEPLLRPTIDEFVGIVGEAEHPGLAIRFEHHAGKDHRSVVWPALRSGLVSVLGGRDVVRDSRASGRIVFYSERDGNAEIYRIDGDGTDLTRLTQDGGSDICPAWSPDGSTIVFASDRSGNQELYTMGADGEDVTRLTDTSENEGAPYWSVDGSRIIYRIIRADRSEIHALDADGSDHALLMTLPVEINCPSWSPDGASLVFNAVDEGGRYRTYLASADGSDMRRFTDLDAEEMFPRWSPDGSRIVFGTIDRGTLTARLHVADAAGDRIRDLTPEGGRCEDPGWSPDGHRIVFHSNDDGPSPRSGRFDIYTLDLETGERRRLTSHPAGDYWPDWGPGPDGD